MIFNLLVLLFREARADVALVTWRRADSRYDTSLFGFCKVVFPGPDRADTILGGLYFKVL